MRYLPLTDNDRAEMVTAIGVDAVDDLFADVPSAAQFDGSFELSDHMAEYQVEANIGGMAARNFTTADGPSFLGAGSYRHHVPAAVDHLVQRGEFLTSYTPYPVSYTHLPLPTIYSV